MSKNAQIAFRTRLAFRRRREGHNAVYETDPPGDPLRPSRTARERAPSPARGSRAHRLRNIRVSSRSRSRTPTRSSDTAIVLFGQGGEALGFPEGAAPHHHEEDHQEDQEEPTHLPGDCPLVQIVDFLADGTCRLWDRIGELEKIIRMLIAFLRMHLAEYLANSE